MTLKTTADEISFFSFLSRKSMARESVKLTFIQKAIMDFVVILRFELHDTGKTNQVALE